MADLPFVSVVIPAYNSEKTIGKCIESLLNQDYLRNKYEIIVVDNNSSDKTPEIIKRYPVSCVMEDKIQTSYAARNTGVRRSKGVIIAFTDADCAASPDWLKKGINGFDKDEIGCVAGEVEGDGPENYVEEYLILSKMFSQKRSLGNFPLPRVLIGNAFYRRIIFDKIGFFEKKWVSGGDADFSWRMCLNTNYKIKYLPEALVFHKHRSTIKSMFNQRIKFGIGHTLLYKKYGKKMPARTIKQTLWILQRIFYASIKTLIFCFYDKNRMANGKKEKYLELIAFLGWEIGRIIGSVRNRVFYI